MKKTLLSLFVIFQMLLIAPFANAAEITAIDFLGNVIGKVLPDGKAINLENNIIGQINSDAQIIDSKGEIIGGIVPQGIAIGNDFKVLGRPSQDGSIVGTSGEVIGKVLPNSLVVDKDFNIMGAVLFPGIVYSSTGQYVGRLSGDGHYTDIQGNKIGFITPDGYAYKNIGDTHVLDGKLLSSKMVTSLDGTLIGSLSPEGTVFDFSGNPLGKIKANEFVFDDANKAIGQLVQSAYAFSLTGTPLGFVSYNGTIQSKDKELNKLSYNNIILDTSSKLAGFAISHQSIATDLKGRFLGIVLPSGAVTKADKTLGTINANGTVIDTSGQIIGKLAKTGPVFNYKSDLVAHALLNGNTYNLNGAINGYIKSKKAYNLQGQVIGQVYENKVIFSNDNEFLGISGINNKITSNQKEYISTEQGYVFDANGGLLGQSLGLNFVYNQQGNLVGSISPLGVAQTFINQALGTVSGFGFVTNKLNNVIAKTFLTKGLSNNKSFNSLSLLGNNILQDKDGKVEAKILPDSSVVSTASIDSVELMPEIGAAYNQTLVVSYDAKLIGYLDYDNFIRDLSHNKIGVLSTNKIALDFAGYPIGELVNTSAVINNTCVPQGVITMQGEAKSFRDVLLGKVLPLGYVSSEGSVVAHGFEQGLITDFSGAALATVSGSAQAYNKSKENIGCINASGKIKNNGALIGAVVDYQKVISFDNKIIGRVVLDGSVVDNNSKTIGYIQPNYNANSTANTPLGVLQKYRYAFDNDNKFIGTINEQAQVISPDEKVVGNVFYDGSVVLSAQTIGYAVYDLYVYNKENLPIGYINNTGNVIDFKGANLGSVIKGFLVDNKNEVLARPSRDYFVRDDNKNVIGELNLDGSVTNKDGSVIGKLNQRGEVVDSLSKVIGTARPLQYFNKISAIIGKDIVVDENGKIIGYVGEDGKVYDKDGNYIGTKRADGSVVDDNGNVIGKVVGGQKAYDKDGNLIGTTKADGTVVDANGKVVGKLDENGNVISPSGDIIGGITREWYEKVEIKLPTKPKQEIEFAGAKKAVKHVSIAITPDGKYLGKILPDGTVVDDDGNKIGMRTPDNLIIGNNGELLGIEEVSSSSSSSADGTSDGSSKDKEPDFFIPGSTGIGNAHGTGSGAGNLGPGGGYAPGERYDPVRARALAIAQAQRRQAVTVGGVKSNYNPSSFDYMQDKWDDVPSDLSSWRVDMSEMILADKPIPAVLARSIYSTSTDVPVTAYVERNVYSEEGRNIIIPAGSRLIGKVGGFGSSTSSNSNATKVEIGWERLIRPDGSMFKLSGSVSGDAQGRQGALGYVDKNLMARYVSPALLTLFTTATAYVMAPSEESETETTTPEQDAANDARQNFLSSMDQIFETVMKDSTQTQELVFIPAGTRIIVYPNKDLWLRNPERDMQSTEFTDTRNGKVVSLTDEKNKTDGPSSGGGGGGSTGQTASGNSQVVYGNDPNAEAQSGGTPLVSSGKKKQTQQPIVVAPPPPSSSGTAAPAASSGSGNSSSPVLF